MSESCCILVYPVFYVELMSQIFPHVIKNSPQFSFSVCLMFRGMDPHLPVGLQVQLSPILNNPVMTILERASWSPSLRMKSQQGPH